MSSRARVLCLQLDGALPNLALLRIAGHHVARSDSVEYRRVGNARSLQRQLFDEFDTVYASAIFERSAPLIDDVRREYPGAIVGGTGSGETLTLSDVGISETATPHYASVPGYTASIGFTQRGCRLRCPFCVVPTKEGSPRSDESVARIWRGDPWPRDLLLLDNDFFGVPEWPQRVREIIDGDFRVCLTQGINARTIGEDEAAALAAMKCRDTKFATRRIYTAWDNAKDEARLFRGLELLKRAGVPPGAIMVYMLVGYWPGETVADIEHRRARLREFGAMPYPMPYRRTRELVGFQRWIVGAYDKRIGWDEWQAAGYQPKRLQRYAFGPTGKHFQPRTEKDENKENTK